MYRLGHIGMWLTLYTPIALVFLSAGQPAFAVLGAAIVFIVEPLPDRDQTVARRIPKIVAVFIGRPKHRGFSHTIGFALIVGAIIGLFGLFIGERVFIIVGEWLADRGLGEVGSGVIEAETAVDEGMLAAFGFSMGTFAILAHLAADVITPSGIRPLWPLSSRSLSLSLVTAGNRLANGLIFTLGIVTSSLAFGMHFGMI